MPAKGTREQLKDESIASGEWVLRETHDGWKLRVFIGDDSVHIPLDAEEQAEVFQTILQERE